MQFMIVEKFRPHSAQSIYDRLRDSGRGLPEGVVYIDSWVDASLRVCFQLVECDDAAALMDWVRRWTDLVDFEIVPVVPSAEAASLFESDG